MISVYLSTIKGRHQLHVKVKGQHIGGSLFSVAASGSITRVSWYTNSNYRFSEMSMGCSTEGSGPLRFNCLNGIEFSASNNKVNVIDREDNNVQVLNSDLTFSTTFGKKGSGEGKFDPHMA